MARSRSATWGGSVTISATLDRTRRVSLDGSGSDGACSTSSAQGTLDLIGLSLRNSVASASGGALHVQDAASAWSSGTRSSSTTAPPATAEPPASAPKTCSSRTARSSTTRPPGTAARLSVSQTGPAGSFVMDRTDFVGNGTTSAGGAMRLFKDDIFPTIINASLFQDNVAETWGGAIACSGCSSDGEGVFFTRSALVDNEVLVDGGDGGAISATYVGATNTTFTGNFATVGVPSAPPTGGSPTSPSPRTPRAAMARPWPSTPVARSSSAAAC